jgi:hypothetical protein
MVSFSVGLLFVLATNSLVTALSLEDKWQELETKLDAKVIHFEEKVTHLETQIEQIVSFHFILSSSYPLLVIFYCIIQIHFH